MEAGTTHSGDALCANGDGAARCADGGCSALSQRVLAKLLAAHEAWFDVERDRRLAERTFPGYAEFHSYGERYVLVKRAKLWEASNHEYLFFELANRFDATLFDELVAYMKRDALALVKPEPNHMSSNLSLVVIADSVEPGVDRLVRKLRFRKNFKMGFWGWSDLRVAVVDLSVVHKGRRGRVITNAAGGALRKTIEANLVSAAVEE